MTEDHTPLKPPAPPSPDSMEVSRPPLPNPPAPAVSDQVMPSWEDGHESESSRPKSPVAASILAAIPFGLGHLYLGQYSRAVAFFAAFWVPMIYFELPLVGVFFYFFTIFDAFRQAQLINLAAQEGLEAPASAFHGGIAAGVFLIVLGAVLLLRHWIDFWAIRAFLQDWWPAFLVAIGAWFVYGALRERAASRAASAELDLD